MSRLHMRAPALLLGVALALAGCGSARDDSAAQARQADAAEVAAAPALADFDKAVAEENWSLAKAQGDVILARHPGTQAATRVAAVLPEITDKSTAQREGSRLEQLWTYDRIPAPGGEQVTAAMFGKDPVDTDGSGPRRVRLIFRDHPEWGRSSYLVLERGDFDCYGGCRVGVALDGGNPERMAASRPDTDEAIAMFIEDHRGLWRRFKDSDTVSITFPVKAGGTRTVVFESGGLQAERMPARWN